MSQVTVILQRLNRGEKDAYQELIPLVYEELRRRAYRRLSGRAAGHTLQPTVLVHEAFLKMAPRGSSPAAWQGSRHFYNAAAEVMKQIVLNDVRSSATKKRGGNLRRVELEGVDAVAPADRTDWESLDKALAELKQMDRRRHEVVMLRYFAGLTDAQVAEVLGISEKTVERDWATAKAFLRSAIGEDSD